MKRFLTTKCEPKSKRGEESLKSLNEVVPDDVRTADTHRISIHHYESEFEDGTKFFISNFAARDYSIKESYLPRSYAIAHLDGVQIGIVAFYPQMSNSTEIYKGEDVYSIKYPGFNSNLMLIRDSDDKLGYVCFSKNSSTSDHAHVFADLVKDYVTEEFLKICDENSISNISFESMSNDIVGREVEVLEDFITVICITKFKDGKYIHTKPFEMYDLAMKLKIPMDEPFNLNELQRQEVLKHKDRLTFSKMCEIHPDLKKSNYSKVKDPWMEGFIIMSGEERRKFKCWTYIMRQMIFDELIRGESPPIQMHCKKWAIDGDRAFREVVKALSGMYCDKCNKDELCGEYIENGVCPEMKSATELVYEVMNYTDEELAKVNIEDTFDGKIIIVTGLSGSGKSAVLHTLYKSLPSTKYICRDECVDFYGLKSQIKSAQLDRSNKRSKIIIVDCNASTMNKRHNIRCICYSKEVYYLSFTPDIYAGKKIVLKRLNDRGLNHQTIRDPQRFESILEMQMDEMEQLTDTESLYLNLEDSIEEKVRSIAKYIDEEENLSYSNDFIDLYTKKESKISMKHKNHCDYIRIYKDGKPFVDALIKVFDKTKGSTPPNFNSSIDIELYNGEDGFMKASSSYYSKKRKEFDVIFPTVIDDYINKSAMKNSPIVNEKTKEERIELQNKVEKELFDGLRTDQFKIPNDYAIGEFNGTVLRLCARLYRY